MVDKELIQKLHNRKIINKKYVLWWQLGFEGRRIFDEREFEKGLRKITYEVEKEEGLTEQKALRIWPDSEVPILIKNIDLDGITAPCFISVKPMCHDKDDGWKILQGMIYHKMPPQGLGFIYHQPHVRGVVAEEKDNFLFWYPISFGVEPEYYSSLAKFLKKEDMWCIINPIHPIKFYENLVRQYSWGRRSQKSAIRFSEEGYEVVPYFDFDITKKHLTVYPAPLNLLRKNRDVEKIIFGPSTLFKGKLDFPIIIKSLPDEKKAQMLGIGFLDSDGAGYWEVNRIHGEKAKESLEKRLGLDLTAKFL